MNNAVDFSRIRSDLLRNVDDGLIDSCFHRRFGFKPVSLRDSKSVIVDRTEEFSTNPSTKTDHSEFGKSTNRKL